MYSFIRIKQVSGIFHNKSYATNVYEDEVDVEIITCLMQKGVGGLLPSAIAIELGE